MKAVAVIKAHYGLFFECLFPVCKEMEEIALLHFALKMKIRPIRPHCSLLKTRTYNEPVVSLKCLKIDIRYIITLKKYILFKDFW